MRNISCNFNDLPHLLSPIVMSSFRSNQTTYNSNILSFINTPQRPLYSLDNELDKDAH